MGLAWMIADMNPPFLDALDVDFESYPETNLLGRALPGIFSWSLAEVFREPIRDELPGLVRLFGLDMIGLNVPYSAFRKELIAFHGQSYVNWISLRPSSRVALCTRIGRPLNGRVLPPSTRHTALQHQEFDIKRNADRAVETQRQRKSAMRVDRENPTKIKRNR
jgi:hypothetical protein